MELAETTKQIPLDRLHVSPENTRQPKPRDPAVKSLAKSLAECGQTTPLIVRPHPEKKGHFEIAAGARRTVAAGVAKSGSLACLVRDLDDEAFGELILIENLQREDPDPKAEAELLERLAGSRDAAEDDIDGLAARCGKPASWVARRLRLLDLAPALRKAWRGGDLDGAPVEMMEFVGSLPRSVQDELAESGDLEYCHSRKEAKQLVDERYSCRLDAAPFPMDDERFFGACGESGCSSDSSAQPMLFGDFEKSKCGRCLNRECFQSRLTKWRTHTLAAVEKGEERLIYFSRQYSREIALGDGRTIAPIPLWELGSKHRVKIGKKSDEGSRRAIDLSNPDKPRSVYLVPLAQSQTSTGEGTNAVDLPTTKAEEKRQMLQARRWALVNKSLVEALAESKVSQITEHSVFKLSSVFGLPYQKSYRDTSWELLDGRNDDADIDATWEGLVTIFTKRLRCEKVSQTPDALPEMEKIAALIGFNLAEAKRSADQQLLPPKAWGANIDPHTLEAIEAA